MRFCKEMEKNVLFISIIKYTMKWIEYCIHIYIKGIHSWKRNDVYGVKCVNFVYFIQFHLLKTTYNKFTRQNMDTFFKLLNYFDDFLENLDNLDICKIWTIWTIFKKFSKLFKLLKIFELHKLSKLLKLIKLFKLSKF